MSVQEPNRPANKNVAMPFMIQGACAIPGVYTIRGGGAGMMNWMAGPQKPGNKSNPSYASSTVFLNQTLNNSTTGQYMGSNWSSSDGNPGDTQHYISNNYDGVVNAVILCPGFGIQALNDTSTISTSSGTTSYYASNSGNQGILYAGHNDFWKPGYAWATNSSTGSGTYRYNAEQAWVGGKWWYFPYWSWVSPLLITDYSTNNRTLTFVSQNNDPSDIS
jgi:hypothetical protein